MRLPLKLSTQLNWLHTTFLFLKKHFVVIMSLGFVAGLGRGIQLGGFGPVTPWMNVALEVVIESARIILFLYVLGLASITDGVLRIKRLFTHKENRRLQTKKALYKLKKQWPSIVLNFIGFSVIAFVINFLIDQLAYETCLYLTLKKDGILAPASSEWTILLFFKNLSVIPFTLVFEAIFLLWITNKFSEKTRIEAE